MYTKGYEAYQQQSVQTMSQGELLLLVYDELLKRLLRAELSLQQKDYGVFSQSIIRCKEIVTYLIDTLDYNYPISKELKRMYDFFLYELSRIESGRKAEVISELQPLVRELRNTFEQASKQTGI